MESAPLVSNLFKYVFLGLLYLFILGAFWALLRQTRGTKIGQGEKQHLGVGHLAGRQHGVPLLVVESGRLKGRSFPVGSDLMIGRSGDNAVVLSDPFASSHHATVRRRGDETWLADEGSTNGTFLNGFRLTAPSALKPGDTFVIGETTFRLLQK